MNSYNVWTFQLVVNSLFCMMIYRCSGCRTDGYRICLHRTSGTSRCCMQWVTHPVSGGGRGWILQCDNCGWDLDVSIRLAIHLSQNMPKRLQNSKNEKGITGYFALLFSQFAPCFSHFAFQSILGQGRHLREKSKDFLNETWNLNETRKVYDECFVFCSGYRKNTRKIRNTISV